MREEAYRTLSAKLRGSVITSGSDEYEVARRVYNGMIDRRPDAIVRCADVGDVMLWEMEHARELLEWYRQVAPALPEELCGLLAFLKVPPGPPLREDLHG